MREILFGIGAVGLLAACSIVTDGPVGNQLEQSTGPEIDVTSFQGHGGSETSTAFGLSAEGLPTVVVGYNLGTSAPGPGMVAGWAVSTDSGHSFPTQNQEATNPWSTTTPPPPMNDGSPYAGARSDPNVIWTGYPGVFAYITIADSVESSQFIPDAQDIVVAVSTDGGNNFHLNQTNCPTPPNTCVPGNCPNNQCNFLVSNHQSSASDVSNGYVDQPSVTVEDPATHVAWVSWVNRNSDFWGGGDRPWIRRLHFNPSGFIDYGPATEVRIDCNLNCVKLDSQNIAAYCSASPAMDNCSNGTETELITFPRVNNGPKDTALIENQEALTCIDPVTNGPQTLNVEFRTAISQDNGVTWKKGVGNSDGSVIMGADPVWPNCIVPNAWPAPGHGGNNRSRMATVHDDANMRWHVYWTKETNNGAGGAPSGQRVFHSVFDDAFTNIATSFEEVDPVGAVGSCVVPAGEECFADQFMPSASWSPSPSNSSDPTVHLVVWHDTRLDQTNVHTNPRGTMWSATSHSWGNLGTFVGLDVPLSSGAGVPYAYTADGTTGNTPWGDYEGFTSDGAGTFFPAYADERLGGTETHVFARAFEPWSQLINGGFESGTFLGWTPTGQAETISNNAHSGAHSVMLGLNTPTTGDSTVKQSFVVPVTGGTLSFWFSSVCPDTVTYDWFTATLFAANGTTVLATIVPKTCAASNAWTQATLPLAPFAGQSVILSLTSHDDGWPGDATFSFVDDAVIQ